MLNMVSYIISRLVVLTFGTLYPAYSSYKAVKTRNVKEYVKWMMYWIVFALFTCVETIADIFASIFPFYYEAKILFIFWLISPWTKGATVLYRKFVHPTLTKREQEIDEYLAQASDKGLSAIKKVGQNGLTIAANAVMQSAMKGQLTLMDQIRTYSTYYNAQGAPVQQLAGVPEESTEEVEQAREAQEHMMMLRSEEMTDEDDDHDSPHYRNKQLRQSLESLDNRLREERDEKDSDYTEERYERERLEQERLEQQQMEWEQHQNSERQFRQERYKNRRHLQGTQDDLPPQAPRHRRSNPSKRERNFTTSLTREEFDNASNMYPDDEDEEVSFRKSSQHRRPYASTENLSRKPVTRKHEMSRSRILEAQLQRIILLRQMGPSKSKRIAALDLCIPEEDSSDDISEPYFSEKDADTRLSHQNLSPSKKSVEFGDFWAKNHREIVAKKESLSKKSAKDTVIPKKSKETNAAMKTRDSLGSRTNAGKSMKNKESEMLKHKNKPNPTTKKTRSKTKSKSSTAPCKDVK